MPDIFTEKPGSQYGWSGVRKGTVVEDEIKVFMGIMALGVVNR